LSEHKHLVVLGDAGAGKSTLVKSITYGFGKAGETALSRIFGKLLPIPIILRDYCVSQWQNYREMLADFIKQLDEKIREDISVDWLPGFMRKGQAILLLFE
jgi:GTPase SAR1 family protein